MKTYHCPFCPCFFLSHSDLQRHLHAFSYPTANRDVLYNKEDHVKLWRQSIRWRQ